MPVDRVALETAVAAFLRALGRRDDDPLLGGTPARVAAAWADELCDGYAVDVAALLAGESEPAPPGDATLVVLRGLRVSTVCPHHLLPARGTATVAYLPGARVAGLGTLARVLDAFAHRLTLQESIGDEVVAALVRDLGARGALCGLSLVHDCLASRGQRQDAARVETLALAGAFAVEGPERALALSALGAGV